MQFIHDILRERLYKQAMILSTSDSWAIGELERIKKLKTPYKPFITLAELEEEIEKDVWDNTFLQYMFNRLLMGRLRYGPKTEGSTQYDLVGAIKKKLEIYEATGNTEMLVDIGNYSMLEFRFGKHPKKHFEAHDDVAHADTK